MPVTRTVRVFHCDDSSAFRVLVREMLHDLGGVELVGEAGTLDEAKARLPQAEPDVVLVDYRLPGLDGVETTTALRTALPKTAVVVLTAAAEHEEIQALYDAGAVACLTKDRGLDEIVGAIREAAGRGATIG